MQWEIQWAMHGIRAVPEKAKAPIHNQNSMGHALVSGGWRL